MAKKSKKAVAKAMGVAEPYKYAPRITFDSSQVKGLSNMKVGEVQTITIKAKLVSLSKDEYEYMPDDEKGKLKGTFKVQSANNDTIDADFDDED